MIGSASLLSSFPVMSDIEEPLQELRFGTLTPNHLRKRRLSQDDPQKTDLNTHNKKKKEDSNSIPGSNSNTNSSISDISQMAEDIENQLLNAPIASDADAENENDFTPFQKPKKKTGRHKQTSSDSSLPPPKFKHPIILEDRGSHNAKYSAFALSVNSLFQAAGVGQILGQRKSGKNFILDCVSAQQQRMISQLTELPSPKGPIPIRCRVPIPKTEGVIGPVPISLLDSELEKHLTRYNMRKSPKEPKLLNISRIKKRDGTGTLACKVSFSCKTLPNSLQLGTSLFSVTAYRPPVMQCTKCHKLGHLDSRCRMDKRCPRCNGPAHDAGPTVCPLPEKDWRCINCGGKGHSAKYSRCPQKTLLQTALEKKSASYMTLSEAIASVKADSSAAPPQKKAQHRSNMQSFRHAQASDSESPHLNPSLAETPVTQSPAEQGVDQDKSKNKSSDPLSKNQSKNKTSDSASKKQKHKTSALSKQSSSQGCAAQQQGQSDIMAALLDMKNNFNSTLAGLHNKLETLSSKIDIISKAQKDRDEKITNLISNLKNSIQKTPKTAHELKMANIAEKVHSGDIAGLSELVFSCDSGSGTPPPLSADTISLFELLKPLDLSSIQ